MSVHSVPAGRTGEAATGDARRPAGAGRSEAEIAERVAALIAKMTVAEKAGQLTQYFYFDLPPSNEAPSEEVGAAPVAVAGQAAMVEAALARGEVGSLLFVTDPAKVNRLQRLAIEGHRLGIRVLFGFDVIHGLRTIFPVPIAMAASWDPETHRAGPGRRRPRGARGRASTGRSRRWSTSRVTRAGAGSSRAPARTRTSAPRSQPPRCAASRVTSPGCARPDHRRAEALRRLRRRAGRARLRRGQPVRLRAVERLPAAVQGGRRSRRRATS